MTTKPLINVPILPSLPHFYKSNTKTLKLLKTPPLSCFRKNGNVNGFSRLPLKMESGGHDNADKSQENFQTSNMEQEMKNNDIWRLFKEAQQNILYLNKQRLWAVEELNRTNREKELLLDKIDQLEAEKQSLDVKDKQSICWELLLRIDSMVLTGLINTGEASDLRNLVLDSKVRVADVFSDILQKNDAELLAEFQHFLNESKKYASMDLDEVHGLREIEAEAYSYFNGQLHGNKIWTGVVHGIGVTFIQPLDYSSFFSRDRVYGYPDDFDRFTYFSRASLDYIVKSGKKPDVLHIHNWETAVVGPLFWDIFVNQGLGSTKIMLTCHSLDSQCLAHPDKLALCGLDPVRLHRPDRLQDNNKTHLINTLKGGVVYSNKVIIMSSMHSKSEIIRSLSHGLESTLSIHQNKLLVAPFGFDNSTWDPYYDKFLRENYCAENIQGKTACKVALQQQLGLFKHASTVLFIFMGTDKTPSANSALVSLQEELKGGHVRFFDIYDEALAHLIFAGSDIMLCQSFHDPVLQVPLKALKYGAAPVSVASDDIRFRHFLDIETTKFSQFINSTFGNMTLSQALNEIKNSPSTWKRKIIDAMSRDFSWDAECCNIHISAYSALKNL